MTATPDPQPAPEAEPAAEPEPPARASFAHTLEWLLARGMIGVARSGRWPENLAFGARLGDAAHALGIRRGVAAGNLALAFPERSESERARILREHFRELGRVCVEYARLADLARAPAGEVERLEGAEHLERAHAAGRGAILLTGHLGNFELGGAAIAQKFPVDIVVKPMSNPKVDAWIAGERRAAGLGAIPLGAGIRGVLAALRDNRLVAMVADQDARRHGVFVPFFGRLASTPVGPAALALRARVPLIMGFDRREPDGRHVVVLDPPFAIADPDAPDAAQRLTATHTARLEAEIRKAPHMWFWLHKRWKTPPP